MNESTDDNTEDVLNESAYRKYTDDGFYADNNAPYVGEDVDAINLMKGVQGQQANEHVDSLNDSSEIDHKSKNLKRGEDDEVTIRVKKRQNEDGLSIQINRNEVKKQKKGNLPEYDEIDDKEDISSKSRKRGDRCKVIQKGQTRKRAVTKEITSKKRIELKSRKIGNDKVGTKEPESLKSSTKKGCDLNEGDEENIKEELAKIRYM